MGFNCAQEKAKFDREWLRLRKEYTDAGMSEAAIQKIYEYDWYCFCRNRGDERLLYHVRHERDDLYRVPLQLWRMAHNERVHDGKRVYRVVRYQARQSGRLISARTGGERERLASRFGNWRVKA